MPFRPQARISLSASPDISALGRGYLRPQAGISVCLRAGRHLFFGVCRGSSLRRQVVRAIPEREIGANHSLLVAELDSQYEITEKVCMA